MPEFIQTLMLRKPADCQLQNLLSKPFLVTPLFWSSSLQSQDTFLSSVILAPQNYAGWVFLLEKKSGSIPDLIYMFPMLHFSIRFLSKRSHPQ